MASLYASGRRVSARPHPQVRSLGFDELAVLQSAGRDLPVQPPDEDAGIIFIGGIARHALLGWQMHARLDQLDTHSRQRRCAGGHVRPHDIGARLLAADRDIAKARRHIPSAADSFDRDDLAIGRGALRRRLLGHAAYIAKIIAPRYLFKRLFLVLCRASGSPGPFKIPLPM